MFLSTSNVITPDYLSDTTGSPAVVSHASVVEDVEYETCKKTEKKRSNL